MNDSNAPYRRLQYLLNRHAAKLWSLVDQGLISLLNFLTVILLVRWLQPSVFGAYILTFSILLFATNMHNAALSRAHNVLGIGATRDALRALTGTTVGLSVAGSIVLSALAGILTVVLMDLGFTSWAIGARGIALTAAPWLIQDGIRRILYTEKRIAAATLNDMLSYGLQLGGLAILYLGFGELSLSSVFAILAGSSLAAVIVGIFQLRHSLSISDLDRKSFAVNIRRIWNYGRWLTGAEVLNWFGSHGHLWLIGAFVRIELVAAYQAAKHVTNLLNPIDMACRNLLPVEAAEQRYQRGESAMRTWILKTGGIFILPYLAAVSGIIIFAPELLELFYGGKFSGSIIIVLVTLSALGRMVSFINEFAAIGLLALEKTVYIFGEKIITAVFFATGSVFLVSHMGVTGAPTAQIIMRLIISGYLFLALFYWSKHAGASISSLNREASCS